MTPERTETVARALAEVLEDDVCETPRGGVIFCIERYARHMGTLGLTAGEYLVDLNNAGRLLEWAQKELLITTNNALTGNQDLHFWGEAAILAFKDFKDTVFDDTPAAIETLLIACGKLEALLDGERT